MPEAGGPAAQDASEVDGPAEVFKGGLLVLGINIAFVGAVFALNGVFGIFLDFLLMPVLAIGLAQLVYVVPLCLWLRSQGRKEMMKGAIIAAALTALANGACFALVINALGGW